MTETNETPAVEASVERKPRMKMLPVLLNRGYFPHGGGAKMERGSVVELPLDEAKDVIKRKIGERADELPE